MCLLVTCYNVTSFMSKRQIQVRGRKEAPQAVVGSSRLARSSQYEQTFIKEDNEYQSYKELLNGFLEKFTRWQTILDADTSQRKYEGGTRGFSVFCSGNDFSIVFNTVFATTMARYDPPDKTLEVADRTDFDYPEHGVFGESFFIRPGLAWKDLLVDPRDGEPLEKVTIDVSSEYSLHKLRIETERHDIKEKGYAAYREVSYVFEGDTLTVLNRVNHPRHDVMTDEMATNLINTIDNLIPGTPTPTQQPGSRATPELGTPRPLPAPRRRTPR
jgi:hypothetical protein